MSLLSNLGGTGPAPTMGGSAEAVVVLLVDAAVLEEVEGVTGSTDTEGELEPGDVQEGSTVAGELDDITATLENETATVGVDEAEASDCALPASWWQLWCANRKNMASLRMA